VTITGSNTTNFGFQKLGSNDSAGYSTINEVVDGIDTILNASDRLIKAAQTPTIAYVITGDGVDWVAGLVVTASITDLNVTTGKLADLSVTTGKIAASAVTSAKIADDTIVNADINTAAGIVDTKLDTISTAAKVSRSAIDTSGSTSGQILTSTGSSATPTWQSISSGSVTLAGDVTGAANVNSIGAGAVTYTKLENTAKVYSPVSISSSTTLAVGTHDTTTTASIPLVRVTAAAAISIPTGGVTGSIINIFSTTSSTVTVQPVSSSVTINGSTSATYTINAQYSVVSLICYAANTWIITGDYV